LNNKQNSQKTILLVEDDAIISIYEETMIRKFGYSVIVANSGEDAVKIATGNNKINLVLMDIDLGDDINGPEAARQILTAKNIPIVFLTSHSEKKYIDIVKGITGYGYVLKESGDFVLKSSIEMAFKLFESNRQLQHVKNNYQSVVDSINGGLSVISDDGIFLFANRELSRSLLADEPKNIIGKHISLFFPKNESGRILKRIHYVIEKNQQISGESTVTINGVRKYLQYQFQPHVYGEKNIPSVLTLSINAVHKKTDGMFLHSQ
jgi:CheY-like chemotaxis protein